MIILDQVAFIQEEQCIGCTKCIRACPVDAIFGAAKYLHTVIRSECTGCELCIASCPVNCIIMEPLSERSIALQQQTEIHAKHRMSLRQGRLQQEAKEAKEKIRNKQTIQARKQAIEAAVLRVQAKKRKQVYE